MTSLHLPDGIPSSLAPDSPAGTPTTSDTVAELLAEIVSIGADPVRGGYSRPVFSAAELDLRTWFIGHAQKRGLDVEIDAIGTIRAWWHIPNRNPRGAVLTGSHLDSVPGGGAFDGPLGIASAFVAVDLLRARHFVPDKPLVVAAFPEEEGSRFGVACLGSRLLIGAITPERALALRDIDGNSFAEVLTRNGFDPHGVAADPAGVTAFDSFVELHVEQGRALIDLDAPVAIGSSVLGHGRWRASVRGEGNHAGTTLMQDRRDPMVAAARTIHEIRTIARATPEARATVGRLQPVPGGTNVIASRVDFWIDVRHPDDAIAAALVESIRSALALIAADEGCDADLREESISATTHFDSGLRARLEHLLPGAPVLDTGAGHDAGVLAALLPTAMLFVRNPTGISHSPEEHTTDSDAQIGAERLADVLQGLLTA
jgi:N-carbamoyl-L-amino-acid hydrolase